MIPKSPTIQQVLLRAHQDLKGVSDRPDSDARFILANVINRSRSWIMAHPEFVLDSQEESDFLTATIRYRSGEALPYILGWWEFYGLRFKLNPSVLIPRPETEHIVEQSQRFLLNHPEKRFALDVGTGSGCIAITLLKGFEDLHMIGTDISFEALTVAQENALKFGVGSRFHPVQMDLVTAIRSQFDLVCANLPYIPTASLKTLKVVRNEPRIALDGGEDGLFFIRQLLMRLPHLLLPGGCALLEMEAEMSESVLDIAKTFIQNADFKLIQDLAGHDRVLTIEC